MLRVDYAVAVFLRKDKQNPISIALVLKGITTKFKIGLGSIAQQHVISGC